MGKYFLIHSDQIFPTSLLPDRIAIFSKCAYGCAGDGRLFVSFHSGGGMVKHNL